MHPVTCPHCRAPLSLPPDLPPGQRCRCPACKEAFDYPGPPEALPVAVPASETPAHEYPWQWQACGLLTAVAALAHFLAWAFAGSDLERAAISTTAAAWVVTFYVLARCWDEIGHRP